MHAEGGAREDHTTHTGLQVKPYDLAALTFKSLELHALYNIAERISMNVQDDHVEARVAVAKRHDDNDLG